MWHMNSNYICIVAVWVFYPTKDQKYIYTNIGMSAHLLQFSVCLAFFQSIKFVSFSKIKSVLIPLRYKRFLLCLIDLSCIQHMFLGKCLLLQMLSPETHWQANVLQRLWSSEKYVKHLGKLTHHLPSAERISWNS